ncbi:hypothetical protein R6Q59_003843 [Mikania micrantha]
MAWKNKSRPRRAVLVSRPVQQNVSLIIRNSLECLSVLKTGPPPFHRPFATTTEQHVRRLRPSPSSNPSIPCGAKDMVVGGTDTTSNSIEFALAEMMNQPEILKRAQHELEMVVGKDNIVEESHINKLPYLHAIMKETLRLHPALPLLVPHCPSYSCVIGGYTVPKGARVFVNAWAIHRDPATWENPLEFRPERFLDAKWDYTGNDFRYFPFGSGRRICAGTAMGERMFMFLLGSIIQSFNWELGPGIKHDLSEKFGIVLKKKVALMAIPTPRLSNPKLYE